MADDLKQRKTATKDDGEPVAIELAEGGLLKKTILREGKGDHPPNDGSHTMISQRPCYCRWPCRPCPLPLSALACLSLVLPQCTTPAS